MVTSSSPQSCFTLPSLSSSAFFVFSPPVPITSSGLDSNSPRPSAASSPATFREEEKPISSAHSLASERRSPSRLDFSFPFRLIGISPTIVRSPSPSPDTEPSCVEVPARSGVFVQRLPPFRTSAFSFVLTSPSDKTTRPSFLYGSPFRDLSPRPLPLCGFFFYFDAFSSSIAGCLSAPKQKRLLAEHIPCEENGSFPPPRPLD